MSIVSNYMHDGLHIPWVSCWSNEISIASHYTYDRLYVPWSLVVGRYVSGGVLAFLVNRLNITVILHLPG